MALVLHYHPYSRAAGSLWALEEAGQPYDLNVVDILKGGQKDPGYVAINHMGKLPTLVDDGAVIGQSLAILEYLEETRPQTPLLPADPAGRARVRALALTVVADTHPLGNLRVLTYIKGEMGLSEEVKLEWHRHWLRSGLETLEALLAGDARTGVYSHGDMPTFADCCLVPQVFNAHRFEVDTAPYPTVMRINAACAALPAFQQAHPSQQPDAE